MELGSGRNDKAYRLEAGHADDGARPGGGEPGAEWAEIDDLPGRRMFQGHPDASCVFSASPGERMNCTPSSVTIASSRMSCGCG